MQCPCGNWIKNPSYTSDPKYDMLCEECRGEDVWDIPSPPDGNELFKLNLKRYNKELLEEDYD